MRFFLNFLFMALTYILIILSIASETTGYKLDTAILNREKNSNPSIYRGRQYFKTRKKISNLRETVFYRLYFLFMAAKSCQTHMESQDRCFLNIYVSQIVFVWILSWNFHQTRVQNICKNKKYQENSKKFRSLPPIFKLNL